MPISVCGPKGFAVRAYVFVSTLKVHHTPPMRAWAAVVRKTKKIATRVDWYLFFFPMVRIGPWCSISNDFLSAPPQRPMIDGRGIRTSRHEVYTAQLIRSIAPIATIPTRGAIHVNRSPICKNKKQTACSSRHYGNTTSMSSTVSTTPRQALSTPPPARAPLPTQENPVGKIEACNTRGFRIMAFARRR